jgi:hypothetical protein
MAKSRDPFIALVDWLETPVDSEGRSLPLLGLCYYFKIESWLELFLYYYSADKTFCEMAGDEVLLEIAAIALERELFHERYFRILRIYHLQKINIRTLLKAEANSD